MNLNAHNLAQLPSQDIMRQDALPTAGTKILPFDHVITVNLSGVPNNIVRNVVGVSVEGYFVATAISYSLLAEPADFGPVRSEDPVLVQEPAFDQPRVPRVILQPLPGDTTAKMKIGLTIFGTPGAFIDVRLAGPFRPPVIAKDQDLVIGNDGKLEITTIDFKGPTSFSPGTVFIKDITNNLISPEIQFRVKKGALDFRPQFGFRQPFAGENEIEVLAHGKIHVAVFGQNSDFESPKFTTEPDEPFEFNRERKVLELDVQFEPGDQIFILAEDTNYNSLLALPTVFNFNLANIPAKYLAQGFRIKPQVLRLIRLGLPVPSENGLDLPFEACGAEHLSFLYSIKDNGTGREMQSEPVHNLAGLGIESGDRPFRIFPKPIVFEPRSVIQFEVQEKTGGAGTLYFVLQGYKVLGTGGVRRED